MIENLMKKYKELLMYLVFGVLTTLVNWVVYSVLIRVFGIDMTVSNAAAWFMAVLFAFITNKIWVFESKSWEMPFVIREMFSFYGARILTGLIEIFAPSFLFWLGLDQSLFGIKGFAAKILVSVVVVILNYIFSKLLVFREK